MESIMPTRKAICYKCGRSLYKGIRQEHHIFFGVANRKISEREGLKVYLCRECHTEGRHSVHQDRKADLELKKDAQFVWEQKYIKSYPYENHAEEAAREAFRALFGRSYL